MEVRKVLKYPPEGHLIMVHFRSESLEDAAQCALNFHDALRPLVHPDMLMTEPAPSPVERIKGKYRYHILIRGHRLKQFRERLRQLVLHSRLPNNVDVYIDMDAQSTM